MPIGGYKITPLLTAVFTGMTVKESICARKSLGKDADEIVLRGSFVFHVKIKLAVHGL